eukprot:g5366.t1
MVPSSLGRWKWMGSGCASAGISSCRCKLDRFTSSMRSLKPKTLLNIMCLTQRPGGRAAHQVPAKRLQKHLLVGSHSKIKHNP